MGAGEPIGDASTGTYVFMLLLGMALAVWPLAVITNFRGYRDSHARRAQRSSEWMQRAVGRHPGPATASDRTFNTVMQFVVAIAFLAAATALVVVATVQLVTRAVGG